MTVLLLEPAEENLEEIFDYYETRRPGWGDVLLTEFRRAVDRILQFPHGWHPLNDNYRRCELHRFPYGMVYLIDEQRQEIRVQCVMHLHRDPDEWRKHIR